MAKPMLQRFWLRRTVGTVGVAVGSDDTRIAGQHFAMSAAKLGEQDVVFSPKTWWPVDADPRTIRIVDVR